MQHTRPQASSSTLTDLLGEDVRAALEERMEVRRYAPGEVIIEQGTIDPDFHIITSGVVSIVATSPSGERREIGVLGEHEAIGDMALLTGEPASADVVAATAVITRSASAERMATFGSLRASLIEALASLLAGRLRRANERLLARYSARTHLIEGGAGAVTALRGLPAAVARCVDAPVLAVIAGTAAADAWTSADVGGREVDVNTRIVPEAEVGDLARLLPHVAHEYDQILVFSTGGDIDRAGLDSAWQVIEEGERAGGTSNVAVVTRRRWTQSTLHALSAHAGHEVLAAIPPGASPPGPRDPIAKFARVITGKRVGVALGAGAAKGFAHIGILRAFEEMGVPIDMLSGCSIGAAVAAGYAAGYSVDELSDMASRIAARAVRPTLPLHSFLSNRGIRDELAKVGQGRRFEDLDIPLAVCATDVYRRCEVTFTSGVVWPRILASMSIPGIYPALKSADSYFVDGAVLNPMPSRQCRDMGAGIVIGVRLTGKNTSPREALEAQASRPLAPETIMRCLEIMHNRLSELSKSEADVNIEVSLERGGLRDFDRSAEIVQAGYAAGIAARRDIERALPYVAVAS